MGPFYRPTFTLKLQDMKIDSIQPQINLQSFYDFAKLDKSQQCELLDSEAVFLDLDSDKSTFTKLYFLSGFFIEEIVCRKNNGKRYQVWLYFLIL